MDLCVDALRGYDWRDESVPLREEAKTAAASWSRAEAAGASKAEGGRLPLAELRYGTVSE